MAMYECSRCSVVFESPGAEIFCAKCEEDLTNKAKTSKHPQKVPPTPGQLALANDALTQMAGKHVHDGKKELS